MRAVSANHARDLRFVRRVHLLRTLGLGLGVMCVASVLRLHEAPLGWWILLVAHGLAWPHAAWLLALRSADPRRAEFRNLMVDSALGGVWIAVMQFSLLPSVLLATMLSVDKVSVGGPSLLARTSGLLVAGVLRRRWRSAFRSISRHQCPWLSRACPFSWRTRWRSALSRTR